MKTILVDAVDTFVCDGEIDSQMQEMLDGFENDKVILTNADEEKQLEFGLVDLPYPLFTQSFNPMKADPLFYENFLEEHSLSAEDVVYFEHAKEAVESARSVGIETHHYDKDVRDIEAVAVFLTDNL